MKSKDERYEKYSKTKKTLAPDHDKQKTPWVNLPYQALEKNESGDTVSRSRGTSPHFYNSPMTHVNHITIIKSFKAHILSKSAINWFENSLE